MSITLPPHVADRRQRRLGTLAMVGLGTVAGAMVGLQYLPVHLPRSAILAAAGPFSVVAATDGVVRFAAAAPTPRPGDTLGWTSAACGPLGATLVVQGRLVHQPDGVVVSARTLILPSDARGCSSANWSIALPVSAPAGAYQMRQVLMVTPPTGEPRLRTAPPVALRVTP